MILLVFALLFANFSTCVGDDSTAPSIYNSTGYTPIYDPIDDDPDAVSIYNSTGYIPIYDPIDDDPDAVSIFNSTGYTPIYDPIDDDPEAISIYNSTGYTPIPDDPDKIIELAEIIEYTKVPIDVAYSREILQNINVSDDILEAFSRFGLWLETQNVDANAEDINLMYIDDDLRVIENYWVFATRPEAKEMYIEIIQNSRNEDPSPAEMIEFLNNFNERYPIKYVRTGLALFVTVENKDALLSDISEEDIQMLESMKNAIFEKTYMNLNWGSSNPNVHADMSRWAAERAGFSQGDVNIISNFAAEPDNVSFIDCLDKWWLGTVGIAGTYLYRKNYNHYYNPIFDVGGAPACIEMEYNSISTSGSKNEKLEHLSYASHYMADLSMPLHTNHAIAQTSNFINSLLFLTIIIFDEPHSAYENNYVGENWTTGPTGHNFSRFAENVNVGYSIQDPSFQSKALASYAYLYSDDAWECGIDLGGPLGLLGLYNPQPSMFYATAFSIDEGQRYLIGLMHAGYQQIHAPPTPPTITPTGFTNQHDITLQLEKTGFHVQEVDLTNLRVSMGAGDSASIYLNNKEILKFVDSSAGGNLYIYNENGNQLGVISKVNGKQSFENMTFNISFTHDSSVMNIEIKKYWNGVLNSTTSYSYITNNDMSTLRACMIGYQSNVDFISSQYEIHYVPLSGGGAPLTGSFTNQQDITLPLGKAGFRVQEVDLNNLRVSMGAGDSASIYLNNKEILKFVDSSAGGNLYIYNENGNQLGSISKVNGKQSFENMTFNISFTHDGSVMNIEIKKYWNGVLNSTASYSYMTNNDMSTLRVHMIGYQSNVDFISSQYVVYYAPLSAGGGASQNGSFTNQQDITLPLGKAGFRVQEVNLNNLRVSMGAGDSASIYLNNKEILKFVDSSAGGNLYIYNENGNQLGVISKVNGKQSFENMTFNISFTHDGSVMNIEIKKYWNGVLNSTTSYSYMTNNDMSTLRAHMIGYQSNVDFISSQYTVYYTPLSGGTAPLSGSFTNQQDITLPLGKPGFRVQEVDLNNLRVSMGAGDSASIYLNNKEILKFVDSSAGGNFYIYNENGNQLGVISKVNGKQSFENMTFNISFIHDGSVMNVEIEKYHNGVLNSTSSYSYMTSNDISTLRAHMIGYQSNVDFISSQYTVYYEP